MPDELTAFLERSGYDSESFVEVAHTLDVPQLADEDGNREYSDRLKAAQWAMFQSGSAI